MIPEGEVNSGGYTETRSTFLLAYFKVLHLISPFAIWIIF